MTSAVADPLIDRGAVEQISAILTATFGQCAGSTLAYVGRGNAVAIQIQRPRRDWSLLPPWMLRELSFATPDDIAFPLASFQAPDPGRVLDVPAAWCEFSQPWIRRRGEWQPDPAVRRAALDALASFSAPPTFVLDQASHLLAVWAFDRPCTDVARAERLLEAIARHFGTGAADRRVQVDFSSHARVQMSACDPRRPILRIPGSWTHDADSGPVELLDADLSRAYALEDLERAVTPTTKRKK